jgi:hypothetical protein
MLADRDSCLEAAMLFYRFGAVEAWARGAALVALVGWAAGCGTEPAPDTLEAEVRRACEQTASCADSGGLGSLGEFPVSACVAAQLDAASTAASPDRCERAVRDAARCESEHACGTLGGLGGLLGEEGLAWPCLEEWDNRQEDCQPPMPAYAPEACAALQQCDSDAADGCETRLAYDWAAAQAASAACATAVESFFTCILDAGQCRDVFSEFGDSIGGELQSDSCVSPYEGGACDGQPCSLGRLGGFGGFGGCWLPWGFAGASPASGE